MINHVVARGAAWMESACLQRVMLIPFSA